MGMTIDTAITVLGMVEAHGICIEAKDIAVETMRKYQQIQEILKYEARLKGDMAAMLTELQLEIEECVDGAEGSLQFEQGVTNARVQVVEIIQQKIDALREVIEE